MGLNIQRNNDLNAMFDKFAKLDTKNEDRDKFLKRKDKKSTDKKKEKLYNLGITIKLWCLFFIVYLGG